MSLGGIAMNMVTTELSIGAGIAIQSWQSILLMGRGSFVMDEIRVILIFTQLSSAAARVKVVSFEPLNPRVQSTLHMERC